MKDLSIYINELLFSHDCVILPDFGGFIGNYTPARINQSTNTFYPPLKSISFNRNLRQNDGLLAGKISEKLGTGYADARRMVDEYVADLKTRIDRGEQLVVNRVGTFRNNKEGILQFEPDRESNFLLNSYGLGSFTREPLREYQQGEDFIRSRYRDTSGRSMNRKMVWRAVIAVPFVAAMIIVPLKTDLFRNNASLNPMAKAQFEEVLTNEVVAGAEAVDDVVAEGEVTTPDESAPVEKTFDVDDGQIKQEGRGSVEPAVAKESQVVSETGQGLEFHLVIGSFRDQANASRLFDDITSKGYEAGIVKADNGYFRVCLETYIKKDKALTRRRELLNEFPNIWILTD